MNGITRKSVLAAAVAFGLGMGEANFAHATAIIQDDFTAPSGTSINGRTPDLADLPGGAVGTSCGFCLGSAGDYR